jgi:predicted small metal-binding protein
MILEVLLEAIRQQAQIANKAEKLVLKEKEKSESEVADLLQSARKAQQHLERLNALKIEEYEKYLDEKISKDDYLKQREIYNQEIEQTSSQISKLEADYELQKLKNKESENQFVEHFKKKQEIEELSRDLVNKLVDSIYVFGENQIEIVWNFADDYEKILEMIQ